jgi:predicted naringenin-chalcone synthase
VRQHFTVAAASRIFHGWNDIAGFLPVYKNAAIDTRHSYVPLSWYEKSSALADLNALYLKFADAAQNIGRTAKLSVRILVFEEVASVTFVPRPHLWLHGRRICRILIR